MSSWEGKVFWDYEYLRFPINVLAAYKAVRYCDRFFSARSFISMFLRRGLTAFFAILWRRGIAVIVGRINEVTLHRTR